MLSIDEISGKIFHRDCREWLPSIPSDSADLIYLDPPFNLQLGKKQIQRWDKQGTTVRGVQDEWDKFTSLEAYDEYIYPIIEESLRVLAPNGSFWVQGTYHCIHRLGAMLQNLGAWFFSEIQWMKCIAGSTTVYAKIGNYIGPICVKKLPFAIAYPYLWDGEKWNKVTAVCYNWRPESPLIIKMENGELLNCTANHRWPTQKGLIRADEICIGDFIQSCRLPDDKSEHNNSGIMVVGIEKAKEDIVYYDISLEQEPHLFALASGILSHNSNPMPNFRKARPGLATETILWMAKNKSGRPFYNQELMKQWSAELGYQHAINIWRLPICTGQSAERLKNENNEVLHSTQKPESLIERIILASTSPGDLVIDPMAGTGTTGAVAHKLGRRWAMCERSEQYVQSIVNRINSISPLEIANT